MGLRRQASLLLANGHPHARLYPLPILWTEAALVVERINNAEVTTALLVQAAIGSAVSKPGAKHFQQMIERLTDGE